MRDVILAAAGAAADSAVTLEAAQPADASETAALREAAARSAGEAEGIKQGSASERARIKAIITSDQAKARSSRSRPRHLAELEFTRGATGERWDADLPFTFR
jgi:hypothetical protein